MNKERAHFLKDQWQAYPDFAGVSESFVQGRVVEVRDCNLVLETGKNLEKVLTYQVTTEGQLLIGRLRPGDWVEFKKVSEDILSIGQLLAPCLEVEALPRPRDLPQKFSVFKRAVGDFFLQEGFTEVLTPSLVLCPGTEPTLEVFETDWIHGKKKQRRYLPTSPELHLKKALARGYSPIFEVAKVFRNGESGPQHACEFWMLEWYRSFAKLSDIRRDFFCLVEYLRLRFPEGRNPTGVRALTMKEVFRDFFRRLSIPVEIAPDWSREDYLRLTLKLGLIDEARSSQYSVGDLFFLIFMEIERSFDLEYVYVISDWPPFQSALARCSSDGWAQRFEIYWQGLELANAFYELNNPEIQRSRFKTDLEEKKRLGRNPIEIDEDFLKALDQGLPPSSGIALGVERLFMAFFGVKDIKELSYF